MKALHLGGGEFEEIDTEFARFRKDRVVDVGDVANHLDGVSEIFESSDEEVVGQVRIGMSEVGRVIRGDSTDVQADVRTWVKGNDPRLAGIEEFEHDMTIPAQRVSGRGDHARCSRVFDEFEIAKLSQIVILSKVGLARDDHVDVSGIGSLVHHLLSVGLF